MPQPVYKRHCAEKFRLNRRVPREHWDRCARKICGSKVPTVRACAVAEIYRCVPAQVSTSSLDRGSKLRGAVLKLLTEARNRQPETFIQFQSFALFVGNDLLPLFFIPGQHSPVGWGVWFGDYFCLFCLRESLLNNAMCIQDCCTFKWVGTSLCACTVALVASWGVSLTTHYTAIKHYEAVSL